MMTSNRTPESIAPQIAALFVFIPLLCLLFWYCASAAKRTEFTPAEWEHAKRTGQMERAAQDVQDRVRWENG